MLPSSRSQIAVLLPPNGHASVAPLAVNAPLKAELGIR
jgi:hypothetical protein